jgi:chloramphenicol 3-O phosphotransferase
MEHTPPVVRGITEHTPGRGHALSRLGKERNVTLSDVNVEVIVLNGGSSSGKSSIASCLQQQLERTWLTLGVDDLIRALSHGPSDTTAGGSIHFGSDGSISVGDVFHQAEAAWHQGVAAIARAGTAVIVDEVFLHGGRSQARLAATLQGLSVVWIGVHCDPDVAETRGIQRGDRIRGQARDQALRVHQGVRYDIVVDTTRTSSAQCAAKIVEWITRTDS